MSNLAYSLDKKCKTNNPVSMAYNNELKEFHQQVALYDCIFSSLNCLHKTWIN